MRPALIALCVSLLAAPAAGGEVVDRAPGGFTVRHAVQMTPAPGVVFRALVQDVGAWWDPAHTFSGDAANLRIDASPGGCFCERLADGGGVRHGVVVNVAPGRLLRLSAALGPLQGAGVAGALTWELTPRPDGGVTVTATYVVGGYYPGGLDALAGVVDTVIGEQLERLRAYVAGPGR